MMHEKDISRALANITEKEIAEALEHPRDFGYVGDNADMFETWSLGPVIEHRDSDVVSRANAEALRRELAQHPELEGEWEIVHCGHWAVGHVDHLAFHAVDSEGLPTRMFAWLKAWNDGLADYSVVDETILSEMESADEFEAWGSWGEHDFKRALTTLLDELDPEEHEHDLDGCDLFSVWREGCEAYNVNGGSGCTHDSGGVHFYIKEWIHGARYEPGDKPSTWWSQDAMQRMRDQLLHLAVSSRTA